MKKIITTILLLSTFFIANAQIEYPAASKKISLSIEGRIVNMSYMDIHPAKETGKNILLLHGKNFNGYYWKNLIPFLTGLGYRVIVPDQVDGADRIIRIFITAFICWQTIQRYYWIV
jgi:pimeloyl-ACP methyl ester carboxylesterase